MLATLAATNFYHKRLLKNPELSAHKPDAITEGARGMGMVDIRDAIHQPGPFQLPTSLGAEYRVTEPCIMRCYYD